MKRKYTTSKEQLPADLEGEVTLQLSDTQTREIFETRARVEKDPDELANPEPLIVRGGPHEDNPEQWYVEILETADERVDREQLRQCLAETGSESNVITVRSAELKTILCYLVESGEFETQSAAARFLLGRQLAEEYQPVLEAYTELKDEFESDAIERLLQ